MKRRFLHIISLVILSLIVSSGVYRHDVAVEAYLKLARSPAYNCVGQVYPVQDSTFENGASCVAIDSKYVLSAAHCFIKYTYKDTTVEYKGTTMNTKVVTSKAMDNKSNYYFIFKNKTYTAKRIVIHEKYLESNNCDIALIELSTPLESMQFPALNTKKNELKDTVTAVGYGISGPADNAGVVGIYNLKIATQNIIDSLGGFKINDDYSLMYADFDSPKYYHKCNKMGDSVPVPYEGMIGAGDSGGPLFRTHNGTNELIGLTVGAYTDIPTLLTSGYYCQTMGWLRLSCFADWIKQNKK